MADTLRVLYVDDEPSLLNIARLFLERDGTFAVETCTSARLALQQLKTERYDAIISDYQMPDIDGISFLKLLKTSGDTTPFIIFTGRGREEAAIEALNEGADFYIQKGGDPKAQFMELVHKIRSAVTRRRAEEALHQREHDFTSLVENATDMIVRFDTSLRYVYCNPAVERFFCVPLQLIRGKTPLECGTLTEWNRVIEASLRWTLEIGKEQEVELPVPTPTGLQYFLTRIVPERNPEGNIISLLAISHDITDRKQVEEALRESEVKFKTLFGTATDALFMMDSMVFLDCNRSALAIFGCSLDQIIGHSPVEFSPEHQPDGRGSFEKIKEKIDMALSGEPQNFEWACLHHDRSPFDAEVTFNRVLLGNARYLQAVIRDVSPRKQVERALIASETFNRNLVENLPDYIVVHGPDGKILYVNPAFAKVVGYDADRLAGTPLLSYVAGVHRDDVVSIVPDRRDGTDVPPYEIDLVSKDGSPRSVIVKGTPIQYEDNPAYLTLFIDITERKRVEDALINLSAYNRGLIEASLDPLVTISQEGKIQDVNTATEKVTGLPRDKLIGTDFHEYFTEPKKASEGYKQVFSLGKVVDYPLEIRHCDGHIIPVLYNATVYTDRQGEVKGVFAAARDIIERKRAEQALRESESRLADIVSFLPDATLVIDKHGRVLAWNHAIEEMTGVPAEQMIGKSNYEYALPFYNERRPITIDLVLHHDPAIVAKYPVMKKEGNSLFSEIFIPHFNKGRGAHLWFTASPLYDAAGNLTGAIESIRDITERKQVEDALRKSEDRYHMVVEDQTEYICRFLPDGTHIFVNDAYCRYFNKRREEIIGHRFKPGIHPEDQGLVARQLASLTPEAPVKDIDQRIMMPDGSIRWQRWSDRALFDQNGKIIEYQSVGRDITTQKELEAEMANHEKELVQFSVSLAGVNKKLNLLTSITRHDINNQLMVLQGYLGLIEDSHPDPSLNEYFEKVKAAAERISAMIQFTKEYEEIGVHVPSWQDCHTLVDTAARQAPLGKVTVDNDLPPAMEVFADPLIVKVFYNLMDNAVRYGGKITKIRFSVEDRDSDTVIVCENNGDAIPIKEKAKIFERGFGKNTGLGLALSREILSITGITITETGEPGNGVRFLMVVPKGIYRMAGTPDHGQG